eukprot:jgi/Mesvir1/23728/Mv25771-RA.1
MKGKRLKQTRKHVRFFKVCFGFRAPFKVLMDGNFIHQNLALTSSLGSVSESIPKLLGFPTRVFVTRCIQAELRSLGPKYAATVAAAKHLALAKCEHEAPVTASECILSQVGEQNESHFFVASQDQNLRRLLEKVTAVPFIHIHNGVLILEKPTEEQHKAAQKLEKKNTVVPEWETAALKKRRKAERAAQGRDIALVRGKPAGSVAASSHALAGASGATQGGAEEAGRDGAGTAVEISEEGDGSDGDATGQGQRVGDVAGRAATGVEAPPWRPPPAALVAPGFKRKRAKGPNPLSAKKPSKSTQQSAPPPPKAPEEVTSKHKRPRHRNKKAKLADPS